MNRLQLQSESAISPSWSQANAAATFAPGSFAESHLTGRVHRLIGWSLMAGAFLCAAWSDPAGFKDIDHLGPSRQIFLRHAQTMLVELALLQLSVSYWVARAGLSAPIRQNSATVAAAGAVVSAAGYLTAAQWGSGLWLILVGSLVGAAAFTSLAFGRRAERALRVIMLVVAFGMLLESAATLIELQPGWFSPADLGPPDGIRLRMLRLARVASFALPVLMFLYRGLAADSPLPLARRGMAAMLAGALGMPAVLAAASLSYVEIKALLPIPSVALLAGTSCAAWLALKRARSLEFWGWLMIALTMAGGMVMGLYAFLMPSAAPQGLAGYNDEARRLIRLGHGYGVVFGVLQIFIARELSQRTACAGLAEFSVRLLVCAGFITNAAILSLSIVGLPRAVLAVGPALAAVSILIFVGFQKNVSAPKFSVRSHRAPGGES
jgi:hypothetical protein